MTGAVAIPLSVWEDTWAEPSDRFEGWVRECAMYSLREYCRPERSNRISPEEAVWTYRKALRTVVDNERKARPLAHRGTTHEIPAMHVFFAVLC